MTKTIVEQFVEDPEHMRLFQQERAIYEVTEQITLLMEMLKVSRSDLARRLGKSKGWVTQLLDEEANKTIRTVADVFAVLGREYHSCHTTIQISNSPAPTTASSSGTVAASTTNGAGTANGTSATPAGNGARVLTVLPRPAFVRAIKAVASARSDQVMVG